MLEDVAAVDVAVLVEDPMGTGRDPLLNTALGSIAKFDLRGDATQEQKDIARAMMEAAATQTVTAALQSARLRRQSGR